MIVLKNEQYKRSNVVQKVNYINNLNMKEIFYYDLIYY
jgi:hypothetical protein